MALVFISHAHSEETLARRVADLLGHALGLSPTDFFLSSQQGRGVAPAASIRGAIVDELRTVPALVVLLTPKAAASPWVWLEAGDRLGSVDKTSPIFVVPSGRFVSLLAPVADLRCLRLDNDGELHELVQAVGKNLAKPPLDFLTYKPDVDELVQYSTRTYSVSAEKRLQALSWLKRHAVALALAAVGLGSLAYAARIASTAPSPGASSERERTAATLELNAELARTAGKFLKLKGQVKSPEGNVHGAAVLVSQSEVQDPSQCQEPTCTKDTTTTEGEFMIDLTKIQANNGDRVILTVVTPGFKPFSKALEVDVRATDQGTAPQLIPLAKLTSP